MKTLLTFLVLASSLMALGLDEAIERAMANSPLLKIAQGDLSVAQSAEDEAYAGYHPTLNASASWRVQDKTTAFSFAPTHYYDLSATYNLFKGFSDSAMIDARHYEKEAAKLQLDATKADLQLNVISAYSACIKAHKQFATQKEEVVSLQKQYDDTAVRYEQGMVAKNELLLIEVDKLRAEQELFNAQSNITQSYSRLRQLLGGKLERDENVETFNTSTPQLADFDELLKQTFKNRSELKALDLLESSLLSQRDAVAGSYLPHIDLQANYRINDKKRTLGTETIQNSEQATSTLNVTWTLYDGLANMERRKALLEQSRIQAYQREQLKLDLQYQLRSTYEAFRVAYKTKDVAYRALQSAKENYRITTDRHNYGQVSTLTLLKAQADLTHATNAYNNATYDLYVSFKAIERISGN